MPSTIIQNYLNDTSIDKQKRKYVLDIANKGGDISGLEDSIARKYGNKYAVSAAPQPTAEAIAAASTIDPNLSELSNAKIAANPQLRADVEKRGSQLDAENFLKSKGVTISPEATPEQLTEAAKYMQENQGLYGLGVGAAKGIGSSAAGMSSLMQKGVELATGIKPELAEQTAETTKEITTPHGLTENVGYYGEKIAEFAVPGGAASKVGKVAEGANLGAKALGVAKRALAEGVVAGGVSAVQEGEINKNVGYTAAVGAGMGALGGIISNVFAKAPKGIQKEALKLGLHEKYANALDKMDDIKKAEGIKYLEAGVQKLNDPINAKGAFEVAAKPIDDFMTAAKGQIDDIGKNLGTSKEALTSTKSDVTPILSKMKSVFEKYNVKIDPKTYILDFSKSELANLGTAKDQIDDIWKTITNAKWNEGVGKLLGSKAGVPVGLVNSRDLEALTGQIDNITGLLKSSGYKSTPANKVLSSLKSAINETVGATNKGFGALNTKYAQAIKDYKTILNATKVPAGNSEILQNSAQILRRSLGTADKKYTNAMSAMENLAKTLGIEAPKDLKTTAFLADLAEKYTGSAQPQGFQGLIEAGTTAIPGKAGGAIRAAKELKQQILPTKEIQKTAEQLINVLQKNIGKSMTLSGDQTLKITNILKAVLQYGTSNIP